MIKYAPKLTFGTGMADYQDRINMPRMREDKMTRMRKVMRKHGLPVLLASGEWPVRYITSLRGDHYDPALRYVLFFAEGEPVVWEQAGYLPHHREEAPWIKNWRIAHCWLSGAPGPEAVKSEAKRFAAEIYDELKSRGLAGDKLGVTGVDNAGMAALQALKLNCIPARDILLEARSVKTVDEIACSRMACAITESCGYKTLEILRPGVRDIDVSRIIGNTAVEQGADFLHLVNVHTGPLTFPRGIHDTGRIISNGDMVSIAYCGTISFMGYFACIYRTFKVGGKPTDKEKGWYDACLDRIYKIIDGIKPGVSTADLAHHFPPATKWGYKDESEVLTVEYAHGIGLQYDGYDLPIINRLWSPKHPQIFEAGNVMAIEVLEGEHRVGGVRLETQFVVTNDGIELIDYLPLGNILQPKDYC
jgi:Xaa-Pro dipeptidase